MSRIIACLLVVVFAWIPVCRAEVVRDLYTAEVPVKDQGSDALTTAAAIALAQVLVKVSGSEDVLREPSVADVLRAARREVQQYAYLPAAGDDGQMRVRMEFDSARVTDLVLAAGVPLWTANRPPVLVWLVLEDAAGLQFATRDAAPELVAALRGTFTERGLPLRLPLYDLRDTATITPEAVWRLDAQALATASERYDVEHIVGARLTSLSTGEWVGDWAYLDGTERRDLRVEAASARDYLRQGVAAVAASLAAQFAVVASDESGAGVLVRVAGVQEYADFAAIVTWLEGLEVVQRAAVTQINGDQLELRVHALADAAELARLITLNDRLAPGAPALPGAPLEYRWLK